MAAVGRDAEIADKYFEKALLEIKDRNYERACGLLVEAIKLKPRFAEAWVIRGNVRMAQDCSFEANLHYERALEINPGLHDAWNNRGVALSNLALWHDAERCMRRSYEIMPCIDPCMNLANMYAAMNRIYDAEKEYRKALEHEPTNADAHINLGITLLGQRKWKEGWEHYEARHINSPYQMRSRRLHKNWTGEPLGGKTILLYPEQGLGDEIAFMRFASLVKSKAGAKRVILEAMPPLLRLAKTVEGVDETGIKNESPAAGIDYSCAIMDLPMVFGLEPETMPSQHSYLSVPGHIPRPMLPTGFNVGLCWQSGVRPLQPEAKATAANKSVPLAMFAPLTKMGVNLISLQKENPDAKLAKEWGMIDFMPDMGDLMDTAALIEGLDLVISVDTAVAHLAGALGKPVWNLVRFNGYWPWLDATERTEWYSSMRIYRQRMNFVWHEPLERVFGDLEGLLRREKAA